MKIEFKNESKMRSYLNQISESKISDEDFKESKDYFIDMLDYIMETRNKKMLIQEGACLEIEINNEDYEVWVIYNNIIKNGENVTLIDFDYSLPI